MGIIPTQQATQHSSPYPLLCFLPTHSCAKDAIASRPSIQHMKINSRVCKAVISYMGLFRTREHEICLTKIYEQWRAVTHGRYRRYSVLPHTSILVFTADEQQMFHFLSILMTLHTLIALLCFAYVSPLFLLDISVHFYICPYDRFIAKTLFSSFLNNFLHLTYHIRTTLHTPLISSQRLPTRIPHLLQPYAPIGKSPFPHPSVFVCSFFPKAKSRCQPLYYRYKPSVLKQANPQIPPLLYHQTQSRPPKISHHIPFSFL